MITVTRLNGTKLYLIEGTPDTIITLTNNVKLVVAETPAEIVKRIITYQRLVHNPQLEIKTGV